MQNKTMNSLDITSLYTNVPIKNASSLLATHLRKIKFDWPQPINTRINIYKHKINMTFFKLNKKFHKQKYGLPMGNPEFLEFGPFKCWLSSNITYFRYIDDIRGAFNKFPDFFRMGI